MLTEKEKKVLRLLMASFDTDYSINQIARECSLAPNGALKILKKFEKEGVLTVKKIANIKSYKLNFDNEKTIMILEFALMPELKGRIKHRLDDLKELKGIAKACIVFGSYTNLSKEPNDMDVLFVIDDYKKYKKKLNAVKEIVPVKIHDVVQTENDFKKNITKKDEIISGILRNGIVFWGYKFVAKVIRDVY